MRFLLQKLLRRLIEFQREKPLWLGEKDSGLLSLKFDKNILCASE